jgi:3-oxoacyl-(acyl-carrier-protein) synthase III
MYMYTQGHSRMIGVGVYVPEQRVTSSELFDSFQSKERFGIPTQWLDRTMGIRERRVAPDGIKPSSMAVIAAVEALEAAGVAPGELDAVIYTGIDRDYLEPATAHVVQDALGANHAVCFDLTNACHGFMNGIHVMDALIATGQARRGLIVTGEQNSRITRRAINILKASHDRADFDRLVGGLTVGDAGAAMVVGPKLGPDSGFMGFVLDSQGQHKDLCVCGDGTTETTVHMAMGEIVREHIQMHAEMYRESLSRLGWSPTQIRRFVHHQVGKKAFGMHADYAGVSTAIMPDTVSTMGNITTATIPVNLYNLIKNKDIENGGRVFIAGAGSGLSISQTGLIWDAA